MLQASFICKVDELGMFAVEKNLDIIGIAKSWLNDSIVDAEIDIENFTLYRKDRLDAKKARREGVLLYVRNTR